jgi:hypothetical protein
MHTIQEFSMLDFTHTPLSVLLRPCLITWCKHLNRMIAVACVELGWTLLVPGCASVDASCFLPQCVMSSPVQQTAANGQAVEDSNVVASDFVFDSI